MYITIKVHKSPLKTRPIVFCNGALLCYLGKRVDNKIQRISTKQPSYFKSFTVIKQQLVTDVLAKSIEERTGKNG